jgi:hypothetical protein
MTYVQPLFHQTEVGRLTLRYRCGCGYVTDVSTLDRDHGAIAHGQIREHLVDEHAGETPAGRCSTCGEITDYFRARTTSLEPPHQLYDAWLCERHAPKVPTSVEAT